MKILNLLILFLSFSCTVDVSDIVFKESEKRIIIDAVFTDDIKFNYVSVSYSSHFDKKIIIENEDNAKITVVDMETNIADTLKNISNGQYAFSNQFIALENHRYKLKVQINNSVYESIASCPQKIDNEIKDFRSKFQEKAQNFKNYGQYNFGDKKHIFLGDSVFIVKANAYFNGNQESYFRGELYRNSDKYINPNIFFIFSGLLFKNEINEIEMPGSFKSKDILNMYIFQTNKTTFKFYENLRLLSNYEGGFYSPPPGNPNSNISNNSLGLFEISLVKKFAFEVK